MKPRRLHHVNFIFRDLDAAAERFERLGVGPFEFAEIEARGVRTARAKIGETWFVLVSPTSFDSVPAQYLAENGEGFFLLSLGVDDLDLALESLATRGITAGPAREGLLDWRVADVATDETLGVQLQFAEDVDENPV